MTQRPVIHIVDSSSRSRAEQARLGFELGFHCEIYSDVPELMICPPDHGIVLARDDINGGRVDEVLSQLGRSGIWVPVVATSEDPRPGQVVAAIKGASTPEELGAQLQAGLDSWYQPQQ